MIKEKLSNIFWIMLIIFVVLLGIIGLRKLYNKQILDLTYNYNYASIEMPNGEVIEGKVDSWTDFSDGDQIQVKINGVMYLTDTTRCVLEKR